MGKSRKQQQAEKARKHIKAKAKAKAIRRLKNKLLGLPEDHIDESIKSNRKSIILEDDWFDRHCNSHDQYDDRAAGGHPIRFKRGKYKHPIRK